MKDRHRVGRMTGLLGLGAVMLGTLSACGASSGPPGLGTASARELEQSVHMIQAAVARHDAGAARAAVTSFRRRVAGLEARGELDPSDGRVLDTEAEQVLARIAVQVRPAAAATTSSTSTTTAPPVSTLSPPTPPGQGHGHGKPKGFKGPKGPKPGKAGKAGGGDGGD